MQKINATVTFVVTYNGKATRISVRVGGVEVAWKNLGFRYSQADAAREWRVNRKTFTFTTNGEEVLRLAA